MLNFYRIACAVPECRTADVEYNTGEILKLYRQAAENQASAVIFPAEALSGFGGGDLTHFPIFEKQTVRAMHELAAETEKYSAVMVFADSGKKAAVLSQGKTHYTAGTSDVFTNGEFSFAVHPGRNDYACTANPGKAQLLIFPYAGFDTCQSVADRRKDYSALSRMLNCCCAASGAGPSNTTSSGVCTGQALVTLDGKVIAQKHPLDTASQIIYSDVDPEMLLYLSRQHNTSSAEEFNSIEISIPAVHELKYCEISNAPFIPEEDAGEYYRNIIDFSASALASRMKSCGIKTMVLGVSGGLDSTMALIICHECCKKLNIPADSIIAVSMPGFGTGDRTRDNSVALAKEFQTNLRMIPIKDAVLQHFKDIGHDPELLDVVYENSQARERTQILMDIANQSSGFVVGTGDLSEIALGWCTYNGDQMSMYAVNASIPKTLMREVIRSYAAQAPAALAEILCDVCDTPVSPELIPGKQNTEDIIGQYDLHDFFIYNFIKYGASPAKLFVMAVKAFKDEYTAGYIFQVLEVFFKRFFTSQFKRAAMPDSPDVTGLGLASFKMPSDAYANIWFKELEDLKKSDIF